MADFALGSVEKIIKAAIAIKKAVQTVRQNEVECREIEELAGTIMDILLLLQNTADMNHPAMNRTLVGLERVLNQALKLVTVCQEGRNVACRILGSGDMSKKLRRIKDDILHKTVLGTFATTVKVTMTLTNSITYGGGSHRLLTRAQDAGEVDISYSSDLATEDSRFGVNNGITIAATGSQVHSAPSSKSEDISHLFPGTDIIRGGSHSIVLKQEIVIIVQMTCDKSRSKAMNLLSAMGGVDSVKLAGDARDQLLVVGYGLDSIKLTTTLRKKVGPAELVLVGDADAATHAATAVASPRAGRRNRQRYIPHALVVDWISLPLPAFDDPVPLPLPTSRKKTFHPLGFCPPVSDEPVHEWLLRPMPMKGIVFLFVFLLLLFLRAISFTTKLQLCYM